MSTSSRATLDSSDALHCSDPFQDSLTGSHITLHMQSYHAMDEIFRSDHHQSEPLVSSKTVIWTCAVLSLEKWVAFLASPANPNGPVVVKGPVNSVDFDPSVDLAACKDLGRLHLLGDPGKEGEVLTLQCRLLYIAYK
jgi:hypothetical protein